MIKAFRKKIKGTLGEQGMMPLPKCETFSHIKSLSFVKCFTTYKILPHMFSLFNKFCDLLLYCFTDMETDP